MNKTMKTFAALLACFTFAGAAMAAPHGGYHHAPAPVHHHRTPPPPPPPPEMHHHHHGGLIGTVALGAAVVGGFVGGMLGR